MYVLKRFIRWINGELSPQISNKRQYKLINIISILLVLVGVSLIFVDVYLHLWFLLHLVIMACFVATINLFILKSTSNTFLCGHLITLLTLIVLILINYWMGSAMTSFASWLFIVPIIAAVTINGLGLIIYAAISLILVTLFAILPIPSLYHLSPTGMIVMNFVNHFFPLFIIVTILHSLLHENTVYEKKLQEHNYRLQADKEKFHYLARYDTLTNLPNRSYFQTYTQALIESAKVKKHCVTVFFMDLDRLKEVNDHYGHDAGDALLLQAGKRLQSCFRDNDFLARLGGDEFTAILNHLSEDRIPKSIAIRILQEFNKPFTIAAKEIKCSISIGLASYPTDTVNADELIAKADQAMYSAKKLGGNTYCVSTRNT